MVRRNMEIRPITADQLLSVIRRSGLRQDQIAGYLGVTQPAVQQWLSGKTKPSAKVLIRAGVLWPYQPARELPINLRPDHRLP